MSRFKPFVITADLETSLSVEEPIHLEGILYDARFRRDPSTFGTPLSCLAYQDGIPRASAGILVEGELSGIQRYETIAMRRIDDRGLDLPRIRVEEDAPRDLKRIHNMSPYRNRMRTYPLLGGVETVCWQALGDEAGIRRLLERVPSIGTLRRRGHGKVRQWIVEEAHDLEKADAGWFTKDSVLRRLPADIVRRRFGGQIPEGVSVRHDRMQAPYWVTSDDIEIATPMLRSMTMPYRAAMTVCGA